MKTFTKLQEHPGYRESVSHIPAQSQTIWLLAKEHQCFAIELVNMNLEFSFFFFWINENSIVIWTNSIAQHWSSLATAGHDN